MVKFTLRKDLVKEFMQHAFQSDPSEQNMLHGFTPFCIQKLDKKCTYELKNWEDRRDFASHLTSHDYNQKESVVKINPVTDAVEFITTLANTRALAWALFSTTSPLTQDLHRLYEVMLDGYQSGEMEAANDMQPHWYAHVLWQLYKDINTFFKRRLSEEDLRQGMRLENPLTSLINEVKRFTGMYSSGVPPVLMGNPTLLSSDDESSGKNRKGKRHRQGGDEYRGKKKPKQPDDKQPGAWKDNKKFDSSLKTAKQNIVQAHDRVNLGMLMHAKGTTTAKVLTDIGVPTTVCGRYLLWGSCGNGTCTLVHDETKLSTSQVTKVKDFLLDSSKKLAEKNKKD